MDDAGSVFFASVLGITAVLLVGWVGLGLARRRSAALRNWLCRLVSVGVLLVPAAAWVGTGAWDPPARLEIDIPMGPEAVGPGEFHYGEATVTLDFDDSPLTDWQERMAPALESGPPEPEGVRRESYGVAPSLSAALAQPTEPVDPKHSPVVGPEPGPLWQLATPAVLGLWTMVLGVLLLWYAIQWLRLQSLARSAGAPPPELLGVVREIKDRLGVRRGVRVRVTDRCSVPFVFGGPSPTLMIPAEGAIPAPVIAHELAHLARYDPEINSFCRWLTAAMWWHPLAWILLRRLVATSEEAADDWAIAQAESPEAYGTELLTIAQRAKSGSRYAVSYRGGVLKARMKRILDAGAERVRRVGPSVRLACLGLLVVALTLAAAARVNTEDPMTQPVSVRVAVSEPRPDPSTPEGRDRMLREAVYNLWMSNAETSKPYGLSLVEELGEDGLPAYFAVEAAERPSIFNAGAKLDLDLGGGVTATAGPVPRWDPQRARDLMDKMEVYMWERWPGELPPEMRFVWDVNTELAEVTVQVPARWLNADNLTVQGYAASYVCHDGEAALEAVRAARAHPAIMARLNALNCLADWHLAGRDVGVILLDAASDAAQPPLVSMMAWRNLAQLGAEWAPGPGAGEWGRMHCDDAWHWLTTEGADAARWTLANTDEELPVRACAASVLAITGETVPGRYEEVLIAAAPIVLEWRLYSVPPRTGAERGFLAGLAACQGDRQRIDSVLIDMMENDLNRGRDCAIGASIYAVDPTQELIDALRTAAQADDWVVYEAVAALTSILARQGRTDDLLYLSSADDREWRQQAFEVLATADGHADTILPALRSYLHGDDVQFAAATLAAHGDRSAEAVGALLRRARSGDSLWSRSIWALGEMSGPRQDVVDALVAEIDVDRVDTGKYAEIVWALTKLGDPGRQALNELTEHSSPFVRILAERALSNDPPPQWVPYRSAMGQ